jgi:hypothetical protein
MSWREVCGNLWSGETGWGEICEQPALVSLLFFLVLYRPLPNAFLDLRFPNLGLTTFGWPAVLREPNIYYNTMGISFLNLHLFHLRPLSQENNQGVKRARCK